MQRPSLAIKCIRFAPTAVLLALVTLVTTNDVKGEDPSFVAIVRSYFDRAMTSLSDRFTDDRPKKSKPEDPDEIAKRAELNRVVGVIFLEEKGYHFTQSRWGARPVPYQIDELKTVELPGSSPNSADQVEGIDRRVTYEFQTKAYRIYDDTDGWGEWQKGIPPHLDTVTLIRKSGVWKVAASPVEAYSLK